MVVEIRCRRHFEFVDFRFSENCFTHEIRYYLTQSHFPKIVQFNKAHAPAKHFELNDFTHRFNAENAKMQKCKSEKSENAKVQK